MKIVIKKFGKNIQLEKDTLVYLLIIAIIGFFIFKITFSTEIYGDEWKVFWLGHSAATGGNVFNQPEMPYIFEIVVYYFLSKIFGYGGMLYYSFSFLTRLIAAFSLFLSLRKIKLSKLSSFIGGLIFMVTPIGLETTEWVRNFDSYLGIALFLPMLLLVFEVNNYKKLISILILFILIVLINTTRSHGVAITTLVVLIAKLFTDKNPDRKFTFLTILSLLLLYIPASYSPLFGGQITNLFAELSFETFLKSLLGNIGNIVASNKGLRLLQFLVLSFILFIWKKDIFNNKKGINVLFVANLVSVAIVSYSLLTEIPPFENSILIGLYFLIVLGISVLLEFRTHKKREFLITVFVASLAISFMIMPLIRIPQIHADSEHRYFIYSALTLPFISSFALERLLKAKMLYKITGVLSLLLLSIVFIKQSMSYLHHFNSTHNQEYTKIVWDQINKFFEGYDVQNENPAVIILTNANSYPKVNNSVSFGFGFHYGLIHEVWDMNRLPESWLIVKGQTDTSVIPKHFTLENKDIFVFEITDTDVQRVDFESLNINPRAKL